MSLSVTDADTEDWRHQANCLGMDPDLFHPEKGDTETARRAKAVCAGCDVRDACLDWALDHVETIGIWGGMAARQRRDERTRRRTGLKVA